MSVPATKSGRQLTQKLLVEAVLLALILGAQPWLWRLVRDQAKTLQSSQSQTQQIAEVRRRNDAMTQNLRRLEPAINKVEQATVSEGQVAAVVEQLEQLADTSRISLKITNIDDQFGQTSEKKIAASSQPMSIKISLRLEGPIEAVLGYLERLEYSSKLMAVTSWQLQAGTASRISTLPQASGAPLPSPILSTPYVLTLDAIYYLNK